MTAKALRAVVTPIAIGVLVVAAMELCVDASLGSGLALIGVGTLLSMLLAGGWDSWSIVAAAFGATAHVLVAPMSLLLGAALFFGTLFVPRAMGAKSLPKMVSVVTMGALGGACAMALLIPYAHAALPLYVASLLMGAVLIASAMLIAVDERMTRSLRHVARRSKGLMRQRLLRAVALRRRHPHVAAGLSRGARRRVERAWDELLFAARRRADRGRAQGAVADKRIHAYVCALQAATRAASASAELSMEIDDAVLMELWSEQENLRASAEAWRDVQEVHSALSA